MKAVLVVTAALLWVSAAKESSPNRAKRQASDASGCQEYPLLDTPGYISSLDLCGRAPEDPSKYPNNAEWSFVYTNSQTSTKWFNADYEADLEDSQGCVFDSLALGDPERSDHVIVCGQQTGAVSLPVQPLETLTIRFKSDSSVSAAGFNITYSIDDWPLFPTYDTPRNLDGYGSSPAPIPDAFTATDYVYPEYPGYSPDYPSSQYYTDYSYYSEPPYYASDYPTYPSQPPFPCDNDRMRLTVETLRSELQELLSAVAESSRVLEQLESSYYSWLCSFQACAGKK